MVTIGRLTEIAEAALVACPSLKSYVVVSTESELKDVMDKVRVYPLLVVVIPSAKGTDVNHDNISEDNTALFYVLDVLREKMTREQRLALWASTQQGMKELKEFIHEAIYGDFEDVFHFHDFEKRTIDPEYQVVDCAGWSMQFNFETAGF